MITNEQRKQLRQAINQLDLTLPFVFDLEDIMDVLVADYGTGDTVTAAEEACDRHLQERGLHK